MYRAFYGHPLVQKWLCLCEEAEMSRLARGEEQHVMRAIDIPLSAPDADVPERVHVSPSITRCRQAHDQRRAVWRLHQEVPAR